jgi:4-hydroxy-3-methylbut-2-enyl diphosphate reductase
VSEARAHDADLVVAAALWLEARALRRGAQGLRVLRTGVGPARARRAAPRLLADDARAVAVAGLCGALVPELSPGDVVVASALRGRGGAEVRLDTDELCGALADVGLEVRVGPLITTDHVVQGAERERLRASGAIAVDMESAWLAPGAGSRPLAVLRVVLDGPGHELTRLGLLNDVRRALRLLRQAAPALAIWGASRWPGALPTGSTGGSAEAADLH